MIKSTLSSIAAGCLLALAAISPSIHATPIGFTPGSNGAPFISAPLNAPNAFNVPTLVIRKWIAQGPMLVLGNAQYRNVPAFFKCSREASASGNEEKAFNLLLRAEKSLRGAAAMGKEFIARPMYAFKPPQGGYCTVYTYGGDMTLDALLRRQTPANKLRYLPVILDQMLQGLAYMHRAGVAHNDIKPQNVMVTVARTGGVKITIIDYDLGLEIKTPVIHINKPITVRGQTMGFRAPEGQIPNASIDGRKSDAWSVGATIYNLLTVTDTLGFDYSKKRDQWMSYIAAATPGSLPAPAASRSPARSPTLPRVSPITPANYRTFGAYPAPTTPQGAAFAQLLFKMDVLLTRDPRYRPNPQEMLAGRTKYNNRATVAAGVVNWYRGVPKI
ncbi:kinase-like domain-containing protein [Syncephalis pseudoplumigaleata]|uniref:Kinase-like domain-containing protein n=1 Tax=Syncephalis pseudoplumigaleata TaxID=1712513 RepID=A0A4P9Z545_9FUNG|nr:kinase-like domain-containing protein [Syncephalis pseudoplumigaleata]|eukprot:RKP27646.1 kinase-like domain-containing protein [Syncephalis pseudoplumigaleata]